MEWTGVDDFDAQLRAFLNRLIPEISDAMESTMYDAQERLKQHIWNDVYAASVYEPTAYKRRSDNNSLGTPLDNMTENAHIIKPAGGAVNGNIVITAKIYYNPTGSHKSKKWHTADYNELIGRIEKKSPAYTWGNDKVPARPFWKNFVKEMVEDGELEQAIVRAMKGKEEIVADGAIVPDANDTEY